MHSYCEKRKPSFHLHAKEVESVFCQLHRRIRLSYPLLGASAWYLRNITAYVSQPTEKNA